MVFQKGAGVVEVKFGPRVVLFEYAGIPMAANLSNGFVVGLTAQGAALCRRLMEGPVSIEEAREQEEALVDYLEHADFFDPDPCANQLRSAYLHVTQRCNLSCIGCYSLSASRNACQDASTTQLMEAVEQLAHAGASSVFFSGGEPFLRDDLGVLARHAKKCGIAKITIITNGTCLSMRALEELSVHVDAVAVSFDGYSETAPSHIRGSQRFHQLVQAVRMVQEAGIHAHIIPTIHRLNVRDLEKYAELSRSLGATMNYSLLSCERNDRGELGDLLPDQTALRVLADCLLGLGMPLAATDGPAGINLSARVSCGAGCKEISIDADGTVYPCHMLHRLDYEMGNVFVDSLDNILQGDLARRLKALSVADIHECRECEYQLLCGGGCRARSVYEGDGLCGCDPYCDFSRHYYRRLGALLADVASAHPQ